MGLTGSSFGGWEVNYLITHSHKFAAANECFGMSDLVTDYNNVINGHDEKWAFLPDFAYYGMGGTLWQHPERYVENSPIFNADKITTPLLILHNKEDMGVPFSQGVELFTALWELHKPAWLLQYDGQGHGVIGPAGIDYTIRQMQFFDHYLKGAPAPKWMTDGIPPWMKGIDDGLQLEPGKNP
jgi:dipeptidyl aminopeptidase/acylaminoacyl peptidase